MNTIQEIMKAKGMSVAGVLDLLKKEGLELDYQRFLKLRKNQGTLTIVEGIHLAKVLNVSIYDLIK